MNKKILVFGKSGQLASALSKISYARKDEYDIILIGRPEGDLTKELNIQQCIQANTPSLIINASAYTIVDEAEKDEGSAFSLNALALHHLAKESKKAKIPLIHVSTDYVFDGKSPAPYKPEDSVSPINAYGRSKLAGEWACLAEYPEGSYIVRSSWVFSEWQTNFVKTMLKLAETKDELSIVHDQIGSPTYALDLAEAILHMAKSILKKAVQAPGVYHFANTGQCSWYEFACEILQHKSIAISKTTTEQFPRPAMRPQFSILDSSKLSTVFSYQPRPWKEALADCMAKLNSPNFKDSYETA